MAALGALASTLVPGTSRAEYFVEGEIAYARPQARNIAVTSTAARGYQSHRVIDAPAFEPSAYFGLRGGQWFPTLPLLGYSVHIATFDVHARNQDASKGWWNTAKEPLRGLHSRTWELGADARVRWSLLRTYRVPDGRLQLFFGLGPALFVVSDSDGARVGPQGLLGVTYMLGPHFGVQAQSSAAGFRYVVREHRDVASTWLLDAYFGLAISVRAGS